MKPVVKSFWELSAAELYEILRLREAVFIVEQNCPYPEADGKDPGLGRKLLHEGIRYAVEEMSAERLYLEAQVYAIGFYEKEGFKVSSGEFLEDGIPHVEMRRNKKSDRR